jgi:hypothetical protein
MDASLLVLVIVIGIAADFAAIWSPGRDGQQWRFVRHLVSIRRARAVGRHRA